MIRFGTVFSISVVNRKNFASTPETYEISKRIAQTIASRLPAPITHVIHPDLSDVFIFTNTQSEEHQNRYHEIQTIKSLLSDRDWMKQNQIMLVKDEYTSCIDSVINDLKRGEACPKIFLSFYHVPASQPETPNPFNNPGEPK